MTSLFWSVLLDHMANEGSVQATHSSSAVASGTIVMVVMKAADALSCKQAPLKVSRMQAITYLQQQCTGIAAC